MSATSPTGFEERSVVGVPFAVFVGILAAATAAGIIVSDGNVVAALAPVGTLAFLYFLTKVPLRYLGLSLLFLGLVLESPGEAFASGKYKSPFYIAGWLLLAHLNITIPFKPLILSGLDCVLLLIIGLNYYRRATGSDIDGRGFVETAAPMRYFAWTTFAGAVVLEMWGAAHGGMDFGNSLWQAERAAYLPAIFFAFHFAFRGPRDYVAIGKVVLYAAVFRAVVAWCIRHFITPNNIEDMPTATTHSDSILFAAAFVLCVTLLMEIPSTKHKILSLVVLPILTLGMMANNRRIVWVEVGLALAVLFAVMPMTALKRKMLRYTVLATPLIILYLVIGWDKGGGVFRGAAMLRSLVDSKTDLSTLWRDYENVDLMVTLKSSPIFGLGYGHKYFGPIDVEDVYPQEHFLPHNSLLGVWAFGGLLGFAAVWLFLSVGCFFAARTYTLTRVPMDRVVAVGTLQVVMIYINQCYGDLGLGTPTGVLLVAACFSVVGKLALTTGAWPSKIKGSGPAAAVQAVES